MFSFNVWSSGIWISTSTGSTAAIYAAGGDVMDLRTRKWVEILEIWKNISYRGISPSLSSSSPLISPPKIRCCLSIAFNFSQRCPFILWIIIVLISRIVMILFHLLFNCCVHCFSFLSFSLQYMVREHLVEQGSTYQKKGGQGLISESTVAIFGWFASSTPSSDL